jgi:hypothetical protein
LGPSPSPLPGDASIFRGASGLHRPRHHSSRKRIQAGDIEVYERLGGCLQGNVTLAHTVRAITGRFLAGMNTFYFSMSHVLGLLQRASIHSE